MTDSQITQVHASALRTIAKFLGVNPRFVGFWGGYLVAPYTEPLRAQQWARTNPT